MKRSMLQTCILGICVLQGLPGFTAIGFAEQLITVSKTSPANCGSITDAVADAAALLQDMANRQLPEDDVIIRVLDNGHYYESVSITDIPTSATATLTLESAAPGGTTIHTTGDQPAVRPMSIIRTNFVTIRGFTFQKDTPNAASGIIALVKFDGVAPPDSQVTFDYCIWDGRGLVYDNGTVLHCRYSHCNLTVTNSTIQGVVVGPVNASLVYLGPRTLPMASTPTFTFCNNHVIDNTDAMVQLEGNSGAGLYHNIIIQDNAFFDNVGQYDLLFIRNQRAANDISNNRFFGNGLSGISGDIFSGMTLALINSGSALVAGNTFIQNGAMAEVFVQESSSGTTELTGNTIAASPASHFGVWAALSGKAALRSYGNTFYSNYSTKDPWNTLRTDYVAAWGTGKVKLTLDKWNDKTPKDGSDSLAGLGVQPPTPPSPTP